MRILESLLAKRSLGALAWSAGIGSPMFFGASLLVGDSISNAGAIANWLFAFSVALALVAVLLVCVPGCSRKLSKWDRALAFIPVVMLCTFVVLAIIKITK